MTSNPGDPSETSDQLGELDDDAEQAAESSTTDGAAADGEYDPAQGSPGHPHPSDHDHPGVD